MPVRVTLRAFALGAALCGAAGCTTERSGAEGAGEPKIDFTTVDMGTSGRQQLAGSEAAPGTGDDFDLLFHREDPLYVPDDALFQSDAIVCPSGDRACAEVAPEAGVQEDMTQADAASAAQPGGVPPPGPPHMRVEANVRDAFVLINGVVKAKAGENFTVPAGPLVIEVQAPGYRAFRSQVSLKEHETKEVSVVLLRD